MDLYVFSSKTIDNIAIGVENRLWAVPIPAEEQYRRQFTTKAMDMPVGAHGVFYCSGNIKSFMVPFLVESQAEENKVIENVWAGKFFLPFRIRTLGDTSRLLPKDKVNRLLPSFNPLNPWHCNLRFRPNLAFLPSKVLQGDWDALVKHLGGPQNK